MGENQQNLTEMGQNRAKMDKWDKNGTKQGKIRQKGLKWDKNGIKLQNRIKMSKTGQERGKIGQNEAKQQNGKIWYKWSKMEQKEAGMGEIGKMRNGPKWGKSGQK